jgi:hypothetical protein
LNSPALSPLQARTLHMIYHECKSMEAEASRSLPSGREQLDIAFDASYIATNAAPIPIIADHVALPTLAGTVNIIDILPTNLLERFHDHFDSLIIPESERKRAPCVPMSHDSYHQYALVIKRMLAADMIIIDEKLPLCVNGLFAVPKPGDDNEQRLIMDARPANACMLPPPWFALPTPDILSTLQPQTSSPLYVAKCDVSNYFHTCPSSME